VSADEHEGGATRTRWFLRRIVWALVLFLIYAVAASFTSPEAYLSTDVGGKTASVAAMVERDDWNVDMGYWAAEFDPLGVNYPFAHTVLTSKGQWVNTTSLPMVLLARPLWAVGGFWGALLLPMLGAVATSWFAADLEKRLVGGTGFRSFWIVGLTTPTFVYALDFWEHTIGLALMTLATVKVLAAIESRSWRPALVSGVAFGMAAALRQEALVYGFIAGLALGGWLLVADGATPVERVRRAIGPISAMLSGVIAITVANAYLEARVLGAAARTARGAATTTSLGDDLPLRAQAAFASFLSPINSFHPITWFIGGALLISLVWLTIAAIYGLDRRRPTVVLLAIGGTVLVARVATFGPTFVPGLVPTAPLAAAGLTLGFASKKWLLLVLGVLPLPLLWMVQFPQGVLPQWGGRYLLLSGLILVVMACAYLPSVDRQVFRGLVFGGLAVTLMGVWWTAVRTNLVEDHWDIIRALPASDETVLVWRDSIHAREAGPLMVENRWLSAHTDEEVAHLLGVLDAADIDTFYYVEGLEFVPQTFDGFAPVPSESDSYMEVFDSEITRFERVQPLR